MIRLIAFATFALAVATSAHAMSPVPLHQPDGMMTLVALSSACWIAAFGLFVIAYGSILTRPRPTRPGLAQ